MAVGGRCSGGRGVCEPLATLGCDGHAVNDTMLAHGQLLVDDPERIGPIQAIGMDQTLFNREYRTQQRATTFDSPETRRAVIAAECAFPRRRTPGHRLGRSEQTQPAVEITLLSA